MLDPTLAIPGEIDRDVRYIIAGAFLVMGGFFVKDFIKDQLDERYKDKTKPLTRSGLAYGATFFCGAAIGGLTKLYHTSTYEGAEAGFVLGAGCAVFGALLRDVYDYKYPPGPKK